jgi:hypothetical protein
VPAGYVPPPGWRPDPGWPSPPAGWQWWVPDDEPGYQGPYGDRPYAYDPPRKGTNGFAIASFVLGILGVFVLSAILGIVFSIVALVKIGKAAQKGKGFAIAGLVLSSVWLVALAGLIALGVYVDGTQAHRSSVGQVSKKGSLSIAGLRPGDCFDNPATTTGISSVTAIPCTQRHDAQVFAQFHATGSGYPGDTSLRQQATTGCDSRITGNIDRSKVASRMSIRFIFPGSGSWFLGQRTVSCLILDPAGNLTSSLLVAHPRG